MEFLYGLVDSENGEPKRMFLNDIDVCEITDIITLGNIFTPFNISYADVITNELSLLLCII